MYSATPSSFFSSFSFLFFFFKFLSIFFLFGSCLLVHTGRKDRDCLESPLCRPPGGERLEALRARIGAAYDRQIAAWPGRHLLIVCHAGVSRAVIGHLLNADTAQWYRIRIDYAGITRIRHTRHGASIECVNARRVRTND